MTKVDTPGREAWRMRRWAWLASAFVVGVAIAAPAVASAQAPPQDAVTGSATTGVGRQFLVFTFDVHSGPSGENPTGTVTIDSLFGLIGPLDVTCLSVSGNRASMIFRAPDPTSTIAGLAISVEDNGPGEDRIDLQTVTVLPGDCRAPSEVIVPTVSGDITIIDAKPFPTSKDQCKNGGWRTYGVFKNQGDCISFVATRGKNSPPH